MYENYKLCPELVQKQKCFRVQRYNSGAMIEEFHEHVPAYRISLSSELKVLRALVGQSEGWNAMFTLHSRLNSRGSEPSRYPSFTSNVTYPEAGVLRRYVSGLHATAWSDTVVLPESFRNAAVRA